MNKMNYVLKEALDESKPTEDEIKNINSSLGDFLNKLKKSIKTLKFDADVFVGGSFAKKTLVKKEKYDIDIYIRFDRKHNVEDLSALTEKIIKKTGTKNAERIHGSRDYFQIDIEPWFYFEIIPILKISNPKDAENITDLSYYHVAYINKKTKNKKLLDEIILAKRFCHANRVYGAESHIKGFSGYAIELLILHYKSFVRFLREVSKSKESKIIIDQEKYYRNKNQIMMDINSSKLNSPIILVDPTYKQRNALATLSNKTLENFKKAASEFLKNPKIESFRIKDINFRDIERLAKSKKEEFLLLEISTNRQEGAIAGSKLLKFYEHLAFETSRYFEIKEKDFNYDDEKSAECYFVLKKKTKVLIKGPPESRKKNGEKFRRKHKKVFSKNGDLYFEDKINFNAKEFIKRWGLENKKKVKDMSITRIEILN